MIAIVAHRWGSTVQNLFDKGLPVGPVFLSTPSNINYNNSYVTDDQDFIFTKCREAGVKLVALAGYLKKLVVPEDFVDRIVNIHPSLLPAYGGKGMYGIRVHRAVVESGAKVTGCTVHYVNGEYDRGLIIAQSTVAVEEDDEPEGVQEKVKFLERSLYPQVISSILERAT